VSINGNLINTKNGGNTKVGEKLASYSCTDHLICEEDINAKYEEILSKAIIKCSHVEKPSICKAPSISNTIK
jgi:hypothetical protein